MKRCLGLPILFLTLVRLITTDAVLKCGPSRRCTCFPTRGLIQCTSLGLSKIPDVRYGKVNGYNTLDLRNNRIRDIAGLNVYKYDRVDLRGNPLVSCDGVPTDVVQTDNCGADNGILELDQKQNPDVAMDVDNVELVRVKVKVTPTTVPRINNELEMPTLHGVDMVDNRSGKMVVVVVSASGGGIGLLIGVLATILAKLYKKGSLDGPCERVMALFGCERTPQKKETDDSDISSLYSFGQPDDWVYAPSTSNTDNTTPKTVICEKFNPLEKKKAMLSVINNGTVEYRIYGENTSERKEESMETDNGSVIMLLCYIQLYIYIL